MTTIKNKILHIVEHNKINMIPRWKFVLYSILGVACMLFSFLALIFVASLVVFILSRYGFMYLPMFGFGATIKLLLSIPIFLGVIAIVLLVLTEVLARQYAFSFKKPLSITLLIITGLSLIIGFLISLTSIHHAIRDYGRRHHIGMMEHMYDNPNPFGARKIRVDGIMAIRGTVVATSSKEIKLRLFDDKEVTVYATTTTGETIILPKYNDEVVVFGSIVGDVFEAVKIKILPVDGNQTHGGLPRMMPMK